jgi:hypothetical protein
MMKESMQSRRISLCTTKLLITTLSKIILFQVRYKLLELMFPFQGNLAAIGSYFSNLRTQHFLVLFLNNSFYFKKNQPMYHQAINNNIKQNYIVSSTLQAIRTDIERLDLISQICELNTFLYFF